MIAALAGVAFAHGVAGLEPGLVAYQTSASADLDGSLGLWYTFEPRPWAVTAELAAWHRNEGPRPVVDGASLYHIATFNLRFSALAEVALGTHATTFHAGVGPALTWARATVRWTAHEATSNELIPGVRGRIALDGPLWKRLTWEWHTGATSRAFSAVDYDTALGLGLAW